jgi:signal transduction histidine kinase
MSIFFRTGLGGQASADPDATVAHVQDYAERGMVLGAQRLLIFSVALVLQAFFIRVEYVAISVVLIIVAEVFDARTFAQARALRLGDGENLRTVLRRIHIGAAYGAGVVSFLSLSIAMGQGGTSNFIPMFFLLSAALFAAMNNHQLFSALVIRLGIYGATFLAIPLLGLVLSQGTFGHEAWLNFFASLVVIYFIADCSAIGMRYYRTNRRQLYQLRAENARANKALDAKTEFLSTVSHELRTPLTSIRASLDLAMAGAFGPMPDKSTQVLGIAQRNATRLSALIDELLDLQKIEIGKMKFDFCEVQLAGLVADAVNDNRSYAQELEVTLKMLPVDTDLYVRADPMRLEQVITNLLSNAAKFSDPGSEITLGVTATDDQIRISVADQGVGVDPADHDRIFDSFSQLDNSDIRKVNGTGLGLNISKRIVEAHGGLINFEPNEGGGTVFYIELTRLAVADAEPRLRAVN